MNSPRMPTVGGWRSDRENQAEILSRSLATYSSWMANLERYPWDPPKELDPRQFYQVSDQGQMGSCQGNALADAAEICQLMANGEYVQVSRNWPYYASQEFDGLLGRDNGSTLNGGSKAARQIGFVLEEDFPYTDNYAAGLSAYRTKKSALLPKAAELKMEGEAPLGSYDDILRWLQSLVGPVQIGVMWGVGSGWEILRYQGGGGGHSVLFAGYVQVANWPKPGILSPNSWGRGVGRDGWQLWHPDAVEAACRSQNNVFVGRSDMKSPRPRPKPDI